MGGTGGLPAEQHASQQGRHPGGFPKMELVLTSRNADEFGVVLEMRINAVLDVTLKLFFFPLLSRWFLE